MSSEATKYEPQEYQRQFEWLPSDQPPIDRWNVIIDELLKDLPLINAGDVFMNHWREFEIDDFYVSISMKQMIKDGLITHNVDLRQDIEHEKKRFTLHYSWSEKGGSVLVVMSPFIPKELQEMIDGGNHEDITPNLEYLAFSYSPFSSFTSPGTVRENRKMTSADYHSIEYILTKLTEEN